MANLAQAAYTSSHHDATFFPNRDDYVVYRGWMDSEDVEDVLMEAPPARDEGRPNFCEVWGLWSPTPPSERPARLGAPITTMLRSDTTLGFAEDDGSDLLTGGEE